MRKRFTLLGNAWIFVGMQQTTADYLKDVTPQTWQDYLDYLLGEYVMGLSARDAQGSIVAAPSWNLVLSYEQAIRTQAFKLMLQGVRLTKALKQAMEDPVVKERSFTTPHRSGSSGA